MLPQINWKPNRKDIVLFGLVIFGGLFLLGLFLALRTFRETGEIDNSAWLVPAGIGAAVLLSAIYLERSVGLALYYLWMGLAFCMGAVIGPLAVTAVYFLLFTPLGFLMRLLGKDFLQRRHVGKPSFWHSLNQKTDRRSYERQF